MTRAPSPRQASSASALLLARPASLLLLARPASLLLLATLLAACHGAAPAPKPECATREDCKGGLEGGLVCVDGKCQGCTRSRDCRATELCDPVQRRCTLRPCFGDQCTQHADCAFGQFCVQGLCLAPGAPQGSCSVTVCGSNRDCNKGQRCNLRTFVCEQDLGCAVGDACAAGTVCNPGTGQCEPGCTDVTAAQVCGPLVPCRGGRCVQCAGDADCGPGLTCDLAQGQCRGASACQGSRDCPVDLSCDRRSGTCAAARPPCVSNEACAIDERCETRTGRCVPGACLPDRFEPNDAPETAAPLPVTGLSDLTLCGGDQDWFALQLHSGDRVQVVGEVDPLGSFDLQLLSPGGTLLDESTLAVLATAGSDGRYLVHARTNDASAPYGLRVQLVPGTACAHDPETPHPDAQSALAVGAGRLYDLAVCPGEETWFSVRAPDTQTAPAPQVAIDAELALDPTAGGPLVLTLFDSDGQGVLAEDALGSAAPRVQAPGSKGGVYFLRVRGAGPDVRNRYDLTVRVGLP